MPALLLRHATILDHAETSVTDVRIDIRIDGGVIAEIGSLSTRPGDDAGETVVDLDGWLLLPSAVEPHAHLDKAFLAERIVNRTGDLMGAIEAMQEGRDSIDAADTIERAERAARLLAANGFTAVRTHVDVTTSNGLTSVDALTEVRRRVHSIIDVQIVALSGFPIVGPAGADQRALLADALDAGADLVGGCPHLEDDVRGATECFLSIASDRGVGVDLHTDETLDIGKLGLVDLAELVSAGFDAPVTASHCVSLGMLPAHRQHEVAEAVSAAGISVVALPHTNLFLQGRGSAPMPRGLTAVHALRTAGATVAAGGDNLQDPFNPVGRGCPFETAGLMVLAAHLLPHEAWGSVSAAGRRVLGLPTVGLIVGSPADLVAVRAATVREAIAFGPAERRVWKGGIETTQAV